jgi:hypothetical protein
VKKGFLFESKNLNRHVVFICLYGVLSFAPTMLSFWPNRYVASVVSMVE